MVHVGVVGSGWTTEGLLRFNVLHEEVKGDIFKNTEIVKEILKTLYHEGRYIWKWSDCEGHIKHTVSIYAGSSKKDNISILELLVLQMILKNEYKMMMIIHAL